MALAMLAGGCSGPQQWINPNLSPQQIALDNAQCEYESEKVAPLQTIGSAFEQLRLEHLCLAARGYVRVK
jgi:hypothetical protein